MILTQSSLQLRLEGSECIVSDMDQFVKQLVGWGLVTGPQETGWVCAYDRGMRLGLLTEIARGSSCRLHVHLPSLLSAVLVSGCDRFIFIHNHPGEDADPSPQDMVLTAELEEGARTVGLRFEDHLIISTTGAWTSLVDEGLYVPPDDSRMFVAEEDHP